MLRLSWHMNVAFFLVVWSSIDASKDELNKLQGEWKVIEFHVSDGPEWFRRAFINKTIKIRENQFLPGDGRTEDETITFRLDPTTHPGRFDLIQMAQTGPPLISPGIYELRYDVLKIAVGKCADERPTDFKSRKGPKPFRMIWTLRRVKKY